MYVVCIGNCVRLFGASEFASLLQKGVMPPRVALALLLACHGRKQPPKSRYFNRFSPPKEEQKIMY